MKPQGKLILVATPIGNLGDMTERGKAALGEADAVLAEDTRHTGRLLAHFGIENKLVAYHDHNKERVTPSLIERMKSGETLALVSDAGTPGISDPGFYLTRAAIAEGVTVTAVPGANAILPALLVSGFPTDAFIFEGFLPKKKSALERKLQSLAGEERTLIFFVPPHQLVKVLTVARDVLPERILAVARELTKLHEEVRRGTAGELLTHYEKRTVKGEIVLLLKGAGK